MPQFKIHRLRDSQLQPFRSAPHTAGTSQVRPRDYTENGQIEAPGLYAAWAALRDSEQPLRIGDILEDEKGALRICKYVGLEEAQWAVTEQPPEGVGPVVPDGEQPKVIER
ncbi:MAG: hypothetical protein ABSH46_12535 [Bryobacteraceae bacterium]|jgi:hypothetical protein